MTTSLVEGKTREEAVVAVREAAERHAERSGDLGVHTEEGKATVMVGIARAGGLSCVIEVDKAEYAPLGGVALAQLMGFDLAKPRPITTVAAERSRRGTRKKENAAT